MATDGNKSGNLFTLSPCHLVTLSPYGPARLDPSPPSPHLVDGERPSRLRIRVHEECPKRPGVYGMLDRHGDLVYVGKAKSLRTRLLSYFRPQSRDAKAGRIMQHIRAIAWEVSPTEFAALHRELELIQRWRPRFNVVGQPDGRRYSYVCVGRQPAPYVFLARTPPAKVLAAYGPVPAGRRAGEAVRRLNDWFRLRDCSQAQEMIFADQGELWVIERSAGCLRHEIGTCLGPCAAACSSAAYAVQVAAARAFLTGADKTPLNNLQNEMEAASAAMAFERAAALRDKLEALRWLRDQLESLRLARTQGSFVYPLQGYDGRITWYLIHGGRTVEAMPAPLDEDTRRAARARIEAVYQTDSRAEAAERMEEVLLVAYWFGRYPGERTRVLQPAEALGRCP
ncbi:MAG TPA: UvrB/UvrC motif-containing protein [Gemmataceae bacterium]|nr:UvrB/UvrC motif-containing protein [Gemmataceae bacterium]